MTLHGGNAMRLTSQELIDDPIGRYPQATVAAFDPTCGDLPRRRLDEALTRDYLERLAAVGAPAVLVGSSTGQGHLRSTEELAGWFRCAAAADIGDMLPLALLRPEDGVEANVRLMALLAELGYPVVFLRPGTDLPTDADANQVSASLAPLVAWAGEFGLAVGLYSVPDVSGLPLTPDAVAALMACPGGDHVVAVKVTETDYAASTERFLAHPALRRLKIVQGWDPHLQRALQDGPRFDTDGRQRAGITSGMMALAVYQYLHLLRAAAAEDWQEVGQAALAAERLFRSMQDDPGRFADLQRAKYIMGLGHPLMARVTEAQVHKVLDELENLPRATDRQRLARSLDLMGDGPFHPRLSALA